jgi:general secretion pathway protein J
MPDMIKSNTGFTLIEIMIALIIFAIIASITARSIQNTLITRESLTKNSAQIAKWQLAITLLEKDFNQIVDRPIRTEKMRLKASLFGTSNYVEFTRQGVYAVNNNEHSSNLQRAAWLCENGSLIRRHWQVLDPINSKLYTDQKFLDNLQMCKFAYITPQHTIASKWNTDTNSHMPLAIQITLNTNTNKKANFIFAIPESVYEQ